MAKDTRELRCVVRYMPHGLDLRLMLGGEFRTTELHKDAPSAQLERTSGTKNCLIVVGDQGPLAAKGDR